MSHLSLNLFGLPTISLDRRAVYIRRRKAVALLAYLGVTQTAYNRDELAALFWPQQSHKSARTNLRRALYTLHRELGQDVPTVEHNVIALPANPSCVIDVVDFRRGVAAARQTQSRAPLERHDLDTLANAVALYRDDFARGLTVYNCDEFEVWCREENANLRAELIWALTILADGYAGQNAIEVAITHSRRLLALEPFDESSLKRLMQLYVFSKQISSALFLFERHVGLWRDEFDCMPPQSICCLYDRLRDGSWLDH